jgi:hypothetical protein
LFKFSLFWAVSAFFVVGQLSAFINKPKLMVHSFINNDASEDLNDESDRILKILGERKTFSVAKFMFSQNGGVPAVENISVTLPKEFRGKVDLYQINGAKSMKFLKNIAGKLGLRQLKFPVIMFFKGKSLMLPLEQSDVVSGALHNLIRSRLFKH